MKRLLSAILILAMLATMTYGTAVFAEPITVKVVADEGWENATYDEKTGILTNVDDGYSLIYSGGTVTFVPDQNITAEKVVIPSGITVSGGTMSIKTVGNGILVGAEHASTSSTTANDTVTEVVISEGITTIDKYAFYNATALTTISVPSTVTAINEYALSKSGITAIDLPEGLVTLKKGAFQNCKAIKEITLPESVTKLAGNEVFRGCSALEVLNLSPAMTDTNSGGGCFRETTSLAEITFPATLTQVRKNDFYNCTALKSVIFTQPMAPTVSSSAFSKCTGITVTMPAEGEGYDDTWRGMFPAGTTFVYTQGNPRAKNAVLDGNNLVGDTLTATYTYFDPQDREESGSTTIWQSCADADFAENVNTIKTEDCTSDAPSTLTLTEEYNGLYIRASITVRNADAEYNTGDPAELKLENAVRTPVTVPTVVLNDPLNGERYGVNKEVNLSATATCDNTTITKVEFIANDTVVAEAAEAPYDKVWTPTETGDYTIYAKAYNGLDETGESAKITITVVDKMPIYTITTNSPDFWGGWNGTTATKTEGAAEDGVSSAWVFTGGSGGGGGTFSLNVGNFAASTVTHKDKYGNTLGKTKGLIDASEFSIRYKSDRSFRLRFRLEYRVSKAPTKSSDYVTVPSSDGEWATATFKMSDFASSEEVEDQWVHNICGAYTSGFEPVVMLRIENLNLGDSGVMVVDNLSAHWYEDEMVTKVEFSEEPKKTYFQYYDDFDYSTGVINVYRGNSETPAEVLPLDHPLVTIKGYNNTAIKNNDTDSKNLKITATAYGKDIVYYVRVVPFAPETLTEIQVNTPKTEYFVGDPFDYSTGLVQAKYSDKDPEFAQLDDPNVTIEGFDSSTEGTKTITVTYGGKTCTYDINVSTYKVDGITSIKVNNPRRIYTVGEAFNYHDGTITPYKGTTAQKNIKLYDRYAQVTGFDSSAPAQDQVITISYSGVSTTYTIDIIEDQAPVAYYNEMNMVEKNIPAVWYSSGGTAAIVEGTGIDGVKPAWYFTGKGTHQCALTTGWGAGNVSTNIGTTVSGLKGVDAISITYKSETDSTIQFRLDYRATDTPTKTSKSVTFPSTGGIWKTIVIPIAEFEPDTLSGESFDQQQDSIDWLYNNIIQGYTTNFEPVVMIYVKITNGTDQTTTIDNIRGLWYDNYTPIESLSVEPAKTVYYNGSELDKSGMATITYKDGSQKTGPMSNFGITYTGFDSNVAQGGKQTVTASYGNASTTFEVEIRTGGDEIATAALTDDVRTVYLVGDEFDTSVGSIVLTRVNGSEETILLSDPAVAITGFDSSAQNTNVPVVIKYEDREFPIQVRVYNPNTTYSAASVTANAGTVTASIKAQNRIACPVPQTAVIFAVAYGDNNTVKLIKPFDKSDIPASSSVTLSVDFTEEELNGIKQVKLIALDGGDTLNNLLSGAAASLTR